MQKRNLFLLNNITFLSLLWIFYGVHVAFGIAGSTLVRAPTARNVVTQQAFVAIGSPFNSIGSILYNPALSANVQAPVFSYSHNVGFIEDAYSSFIFGFPTDLGTLSFAFLYYDAGAITLIRSVSLDEILIDSAQQEVTLLFNLSNSSKNNSSIASYLGFDVGINVKYTYSKILEQYKDSTLSVDFGIARLIGGNFFLGGSLSNLGSKFKFDEDESHSDTLPFQVATGGGYLFDSPFGVNSIVDKILTGIGVSKPVGNQENYNFYFGTEFFLTILRIQIGINTVHGLGRYNIGLGYRLVNFFIDYAVQISDVAQNHYITLEYSH